MNDNQQQVPPEFAALGITEGESVVISRPRYEALMGARKACRLALSFQEAAMSLGAFQPVGLELQAAAVHQILDSTESALRAAGIDLEDKT